MTTLGEAAEAAEDGGEAQGSDEGAQAAAETKATGSPGAEEAAGQEAEGQGGSADGAPPEVPDAYKGEDGEPDIAKLVERARAADEADEATGEVPESPEGYDLTGIKVGEEEIELQSDDPTLQEYLKFAHEAGRSNEQVKSDLAFFGKALTAQQKAEAEAEAAEIDAELKKLGENVKGRVEAVTKGLASYGSEEDAKSLVDRLRKAGEFTILEKLYAAAHGGDDQASPASTGSRKAEKTPAERIYTTMNGGRAA